MIKHNWSWLNLMMDKYKLHIIFQIYALSSYSVIII